MTSSKYLSELTSLLATALLRKQKRLAEKHVEQICAHTEKALDDVPVHGKVQPTEARTLKTGEDRHA